MSRIDIIGQNGNDGLAYEDLEMRDKCSGCVTTCEPCKENPNNVYGPINKPWEPITLPELDEQSIAMAKILDKVKLVDKEGWKKIADGIDTDIYNSLVDGLDNGKSGSHYELPEGATELKHLIWYKNMNGQVAEAFRKLWRLGEGDRNDVVRDLNGVIAYCEQELERLDMYEQR